MNKKERIARWLYPQCKWASEEDFKATLEIYCHLEPEAEHILSFYKETGKVLAPEGDYPAPEAIRHAHPDLTDIALISLYDSLLKFDLRRPV